MDVECPYCTMNSLEPIDGLDEVRFSGTMANGDELNEVGWIAFRCATCTRVVILDEKGIS